MSTVSVPMANERINELILSIEKKHNISIIYLCEYGSRVLGYSRPESDYDLCGIFVGTRQDYLHHSIFPTRMEMSEFYDDRLYDFQLWNVCKVLSLFINDRNQTPLLWLRSPIVYRKRELSVEPLTSFLQRENEFNLYAAVKHNNGVGVNAFYNFPKLKCVKKLTVCLYYFFTVEWMLQNKEVNYPMDVNDTLKDLSTMSPTTPFLRNFDRIAGVFKKTVKLRQSNDTESEFLIPEDPDVQELVGMFKVEVLPNFKSRIEELKKREKSNSNKNNFDEIKDLFERVIDTVNS